MKSTSLTTFSKSTRPRRCGVIKIAIVSLVFLNSCAATSAERTPEPMSLEQMNKMLEEISNWGRWGEKDEYGTLNLITPEVKAKAAALVERGISVSLARNLDREKSAYNPLPFEHSSKVRDTGNHGVISDTYSVQYHGGAHTHVDALNHITYRGKSYNGVSEDVANPANGGALGIHAMADGIVSRGVLVDIPWLLGVEYLNRGEAITVADFEAWEAKTGIKIGKGDVLLVRTGRWTLDKKRGAVFLGEGAAGLHVSVVPWLKARDVAVLGSDAGNDVIPSGVEGESIPVHLLAIYGLGMPLFDNLDLDELASEALKYKKREFLFVAAPLRAQGGSGSPINPLAIF